MVLAADLRRHDLSFEKAISSGFRSVIKKYPEHRKDRFLDTDEIRRLIDAMSCGEAQVVRTEKLGDQTRLHLTLAGHDIITLTDPHTDLEPGDSLKIQPRNPLYFDAVGSRIA